MKRSASEGFIASNKNQKTSEHTANKKKKVKKHSLQSDLPIAAYRDAIISSVANYQTTVIVGETGSGKSTQLAQYLLDATNLGKVSRSIVCTQPRRVAAITIAQRVAYERGQEVGGEVGYAVRFENKTSHLTRIQYVTDGVLLRQAMSDTMLSAYDIIILDESHERSLQTDVLMGILKSIQVRRPALRVVIMSATLEVQLFMSFFHNTNHVKIPGRQFPVEIYYTPQPEEDYLDAALVTCLQIHAEEQDGGVLVFLPGQEDIENLVAMLQEHLPCVDTTRMNASTQGSVLNNFALYPLYAALSQEEQLKAFNASPKGIRKFVIATNIAETSLTISGIRYVVDTGYHKCRSVVSTGMESLRVTPVSKSQANQRAGRAGRESAGKCFRLYCEDAFETLKESSLPEILRTNVTQVVLQLKAMAIDASDFPFPSPPSSSSVKRAFLVLTALDAVDKTKNLTVHGLKMAKLPLDPMLTHLLLRSVDFGCVEEAVVAVAMLSSENIFLQPHREDEKQLAAMAHKRFASKDGDLITLVNIYYSWLKANRDKAWAKHQFLSQRALQHASEVFQQLAQLLIELGVDPKVSCRPEKIPFLKCIASGMFLNVAKRNVASTFVKKISRLDVGRSDDDEAPYKAMHGGQGVYIHPSSVLFSLPGGEKKLPQYVAFNELLVTSKQYMRCITAVEESWLMEVAPKFYKRPSI